MNKNMMKLMLVGFVALLSTVSMAREIRERVVIEMFDRFYQGNSTIFLKQELQRIRPDLPVNRMELVSVNLFAKSRFGRGEVNLQVGNERSYTEIINGRPHDFNSNDPYTYDQIQLSSPRRTSVGVWQLNLRGEIKVKRVVIILESGFAPDPINNRVILNMWGSEFDRNSIVALKMELQRQRPDLDLDRFDLESVVVMAKSRMGQGRISLRIGHQTSYEQVIPGNSRDFDYEAPFTYSRITLRAFSSSSSSPRDVWQLLLTGNIKIQTIEVNLRRKQFHR